MAPGGAVKTALAHLSAFVTFALINTNTSSSQMYSRKKKLFVHYNFQPEANLKTVLLYQSKRVINLVVDINVFNRATIKAACSIDLRMFPMDSQVCPLILESCKCVCCYNYASN